MPTFPDPSSPHPLLLFDGVCGLCDRAVDFILAHDHQRQFLFSPLQSPAGQATLRRSGLDPNYLQSPVLFHGGKIYTYSSAALNVARLLGWPWKIFYLGILCPPFIRNAIYRVIARHRYQWFGKRDTCRMPTPAERELFITDALPDAAKP